jgi:hypothetical protein
MIWEYLPSALLYEASQTEKLAFSFLSGYFASAGYQLIRAADELDKSKRLRLGISWKVRAASTCSITFHIRRRRASSVKADKSFSKDSRKKAFTPRSRAVKRLSFG